MCVKTRVMNRDFLSRPTTGVGRPIRKRVETEKDRYPVTRQLNQRSTKSKEQTFYPSIVVKGGFSLQSWFLHLYTFRGYMGRVFVEEFSLSTPL